MVKNALLCKPGSEDVIEEYEAEKSLTHRTRRQLVDILASHMTESHGLSELLDCKHYIKKDYHDKNIALN